MLTGDLGLLSHPKGLCTQFVCGKVSRKLNGIFNVSETVFTGDLGLLSHPKDFCTKYVCGKISRKFNRIFNVRNTVLMGGGGGGVRMRGGDLGLLSHTKDFGRVCTEFDCGKVLRKLGKALHVMATQAVVTMHAPWWTTPAFEGQCSCSVPPTPLKREGIDPSEMSACKMPPTVVVLLDSALSSASALHTTNPSEIRGSGAVSSGESI